MEKYARKGLKKLLSLARTKIRLAEESGTVETRPKPLRVVGRLSGEEINTVGEAKDHLEKLGERIGSEDPKALADKVFQLLDIVEGVKYRFEPPEYCLLMGEEELKAYGRGGVKLLLMTQENPEGKSLYIGEEPPVGAKHLGRVPSTAKYLVEYLSEEDIEEIEVYLGRKSLILDAIYYSFGAFGAKLR